MHEQLHLILNPLVGLLSTGISKAILLSGTDCAWSDVHAHPITLL